MTNPTSQALNSPVLSAERRALILALKALRKIGWHAPDVAAPVLARKAETDVLTLVPEARDWQ